MLAGEEVCREEKIKKAKMDKPLIAGMNNFGSRVMYTPLVRPIKRIINH